jgi:Methane oxygenase PmoA
VDRPRRIGRAARTTVDRLDCHRPAAVEIDLRVWVACRGRRSARFPRQQGRIGGGYGGFFWRFPACDNVEVFTAEARGEDEVHGTLGPWLAWSADFAAGAGISGPATIVITAPDAAAAAEPWFVRVREYPAVGSALAWDRPVSLAAGGVLRRRFDVAIADGRLAEAETRELAAEVTASRL